MHIPDSLNVQWHITNRCNQRCLHCYQKEYDDNEPSFSDLLFILEQIKKFVVLCKKNSKKKDLKAQITLTGGEPFIRDDFILLLEKIHSIKPLFKFAILSNSTLINNSILTKLQDLKPSYFQVSIDGNNKSHDYIRGQGNHQKVIQSIRKLIKYDIPTIISFTSHQYNYLDFPDVAKLGRSLKVKRVWADRLVPMGNATLQKMKLTKKNTQEFFKIMYNERKKAQQSLFCKTEISMNRALQFLIAGGRPYHCTAGDRLINIMPNGDLYPCRRMPIKVGNLFDNSLIDLYQNSILFNHLRDNEKIPSECKGCFYAHYCKGGLKCLSYAETDDPFNSDPGCWLIN